MRLYPVYWLILILTVLFSLAIYLSTGHKDGAALQPYIDNYTSLSAGSFVFFIFTNLVIFLQDAVMFLGINTTTGNFFFTPDFTATHPLAYTFLFIPQAWTIGLELMFYLIAPFIVRRKLMVVLSIIILSVSIRLLLYKNGLRNDPWTCRFFPTELAFFLAGNLGYRAYKKIQTMEIPAWYIDAALAMLITIIFFFDRIIIPAKQYMFMAYVFLIIPFVFYRFRNSNIDSYIGELSYPIYISHIFIMTVLLSLHISYKTGLLPSIITIVFSVAINELLAKRIEKIRQQRVRRALI